MEFHVLGPVHAWLDSGRAACLGTRQQRFLLAVLALEANSLIPTQQRLYSPQPG